MGLIPLRHQPGEFAFGAVLPEVPAVAEDGQAAENVQPPPSSSKEAHGFREGGHVAPAVWRKPLILAARARTPKAVCAERVFKNPWAATELSRVVRLGRVRRAMWCIVQGP